MDPPDGPSPETGPPSHRLSSEERTARNEAIARRRLEGATVAEAAREFGVSRNTVKRASRDFAAALRREDQERELTAVRDVDVEALIALGVEAHAEGLTRMLTLLRGPDGTLVILDGRRSLGASSASSPSCSSSAASWSCSAGRSLRPMLRPEMLRRPVPVPPELRLLDAILDDPVEDYMARQRRAAAYLRERREGAGRELYRRAGLPPFD